MTVTTKEGRQNAEAIFFLRLRSEIKLLSSIGVGSALAWASSRQQDAQRPLLHSHSAVSQ